MTDSQQHNGHKNNYPRTADVESEMAQLGAEPIDETLLARGENAVAFVHFDAPSTKSNTIEALVHYSDLPHIDRGRYVTIESGTYLPDGEVENQRTFTGRIIEGPFYNPDALKRDSTPVQFIILNQGKGKGLAIPEYHGLVTIEILGEQKDGALIGAITRPRPGSPINSFDTSMMAEMFNLRGDIILGSIDGYDDVQLRIDANDKSVVPRNWLTVGTIGSGKSNTDQVFIEETTKAGYAQIVIDPEGEYIFMDQPSTQQGIEDTLQQHGMQLQGVSGITVYVPPGATSDREDAVEFSVPFSSLPADMIMEITEMTTAQKLRFPALYERAVEVLRRRKRKKRNDGHSDDYNVPSGVPDMTLDLLLEILEDELDFREPEKSERPSSAKIKKMSPEEQVALLDNENDRKDEEVPVRQPYFKLYNMKPLVEKGPDRASYRALQRRLQELNRSGIFDKDGTQQLDMKALSEPGHLSVIDMSDSESQETVNIVIADLLSRMYHFKMALSEEENKARRVFITIEEAHGFVSRERKDKMEQTLDQLRRIARRGRKRWLALHFVTQSPEHLPSELFELANNKIIHQTTGSQNLRVLKAAAGNVNDAIWDEVPTLGRGRAVVVSSQFPHPMIVRIRPAASRRYYIE